MHSLILSHLYFISNHGYSAHNHTGKRRKDSEMVYSSQLENQLTQDKDVVYKTAQQNNSCYV